MSDPNPDPYRPPAGTDEATPTPAPPAGLGASGTGGLMFGTQPSVPSQDLSGDKLLATAPRMPMADKPVPALGGIPLLAKLGQGGMGAVYYGIHPRLKLEVAVKVLPFNLAEKNPGLIERFYREANIAARVRSPHLVLVTDVNEDCGLFFLVMEFVRGTSAGSYLRTLRQAGRPGLSETTALDICIAATQGLCAAHGEGVIHRDIKPDNIMLPYAKGTEDPLFAAAKLADLGLARGEGNEKSLTGSQSAMGTPGYMAPEQGMDAKAARKPADVFSMGATLYALLSGNAPFVGSSLMKVLLDTAQAPHTPIRKFRPEVSEVTEAFLARCLAKDPAQRYPDAFALLEALKVCRKVLGEPQETVKKAVEQLTLLQKAAEIGSPVVSPVIEKIPPTQPLEAAVIPPKAQEQRAKSPAPAEPQPPIRKTPPQEKPQVKQAVGHAEAQRDRPERDSDRARKPDRSKGKAGPVEQALPPRAQSFESARRGSWGWVLGVILVGGACVYGYLFFKNGFDQGIPSAADQSDSNAELKANNPKDAPSESARKASLEAQAGVEALRGQVEKSEAELKNLIEKNPADVLFKRLGEACALHAFDGPVRLETETAFNLGNKLVTDKYYAEAVEKFKAAETAYRTALNFRIESEKVLRDEATVRTLLDGAWKDRTSEERNLYAPVSALLSEALKAVAAGALSDAQGQIRVAAKTLDEADAAVAARREAHAARKIVASLAVLPAYAPDLRKGDEALREGEAQGKQGAFDKARPAYTAAKETFVGVLVSAKKDAGELLALAQDHRGKKQYPDALKSLELLFQIEPEHVEARTLKAVVEEDRDYEAAMQEGANALDHAQRQLGEIEKGDAKEQECLAAFEAAAMAHRRALAVRQDDAEGVKGLAAAETGKLEARYRGAMWEARTVLASEKAGTDGFYGNLSEEKRKQVESSLDRALGLKKGDAAAKGLKDKMGWPYWDGKESVAEYAKRAGLEPTQVFTLNGERLELVLIPAGKFLMGSPAHEDKRDSDEKQHEVTLSTPYYMGKYEITQAQWEAVMGNNPSRFKGRSHPVEQVSWDDIQAFLRRAGFDFRLPTEAQWEYACRAGMTTAYYSGDGVEALARVGWYRTHGDSNSSYSVGQKQPNVFGLHDMHGNVWEWCADWYDRYAEGAAKDPTGPVTGTSRVLRGGSWNFNPEYCRAAHRNRNTPYSRILNYGFRVVSLPRTSGFQAPKPTERRAVQAPQTPESELKPRAWPLWDGKESVADYAKRVGLETTKTIDLKGERLELVLIPAGKFTMGSPEDEAGRDFDEGPQHEVTISKSFYLGKFEVTVAQFKRFVDATNFLTDAEKDGKGVTIQGREWHPLAGANWKNPGFEQKEDHPVCLVSWNDAKAFCHWVSRLSGRVVRLPTEVEWEYACRAGTRTSYIWGNDPDEGKGWGNAVDQASKQHFARETAFNWTDDYVFTAPVGKFKSNAFGLFDMTGNVGEWCEDWYGAEYYADTPAIDPTGPIAGEYRIMRGGSWDSLPRNCRAADRGRLQPGGLLSINGFRLLSFPLPRQRLKGSENDE